MTKGLEGLVGSRAAPVSSRSIQSFRARMTSSRRTRSWFASSSSKMKSYLGSFIIARSCVTAAIGVAPRPSSARTLIRLFSSTIFARKAPSKPPKECSGGPWICGRRVSSRCCAGCPYASRAGARAERSPPPRSEVIALESIGRISQSRMPRLFVAAAAPGCGAGWPVVCPPRPAGACPERSLVKSGPSCPPSWSTCFWKWSKRRDRFTAERAR